jgi:Ca2+-dependent lipid-binding protein
VQAHFGNINPQISITVNSNKEYTSTKKDAGCDAEWNETLVFNVDAQPEDLVQVKVKHDTTFNPHDITIGIFSLSLGDFLQHQHKTLKMQVVDEESFEPTGSECTAERHRRQHPSVCSGVALQTN